jgi:hypothetical protein
VRERAELAERALEGIGAGRMPFTLSASWQLLRCLP